LLSILVCTAALSAGSAGAASAQLSFGLQQRLKAGAGTEQSTNWAGYAVTARKSFTSVTGKWVQPPAPGAGLAPTSSAFWGGLGGFSNNSFAVEQTGTLANCSSGAPSYTAWYELYPKAPALLKMARRPRQPPPPP